MSRTLRLMTVRIKTGSHAGEFREVPHDIGVELVRSDRAEIAAFDDHWFDRMIRCFITPRKQAEPELDLTNHWYERLAAPLKRAQIQAAQEKREATVRSLLLDPKLRAGVPTQEK